MESGGRHSFLLGVSRSRSGGGGSLTNNSLQGFPDGVFAFFLMQGTDTGHHLFGTSGVMAGLLAMWTYYTALKAGATSKIVPISACYPLVTALLSVLILKEGITVPRVMGTALIVLGIWLVK